MVQLLEGFFLKQAFEFGIVFELVPSVLNRLLEFMEILVNVWLLNNLTQLVQKHEDKEWRKLCQNWCQNRLETAQFGKCVRVAIVVDGLDVHIVVNHAVYSKGWWSCVPLFVSFNIILFELHFLLSMVTKFERKPEQSCRSYFFLLDPFEEANV